MEADRGPSRKAAGGAGWQEEIPALWWSSAQGPSPRSLYGYLAQEAGRYSVWGTQKLNLGDERELENRAEEISRAVERIVSRAADDFMGRKFEDLLDRSAAVVRFRRAVGQYTAVTLQGVHAALGASDQAASPGASRVGVRGRKAWPRTTARLQVDLHPKVILKTHFRLGTARLEVPLSGSEYRFTLARPLTTRVSSELFAAYPREEGGNPRAGVHLFVAF